MKIRIRLATLELVQGDITRQETEAIVNAANSRLAGGGGVDGAIHRAGGTEIAESCRRLGSCPTGEAVITPAGRLKARYVIHAVGPVWRGGGQEESRLLASAYRRSLELALEHKLKSVAFPSISTGAYGYPVDQAAGVALQTVIGFLQENPGIELVRFVLFSPRVLEIYTDVLARMAEDLGD